MENVSVKCSIKRFYFCAVMIALALALLLAHDKSSLAATPQISCGVMHSLFLRSDGTVWAWGHNGGAELGINTGSPYYRKNPIQVPIRDVIAIAAGYQHNLAIVASTHNNMTFKEVWGWGGNWFRQVEDSYDESVDIIQPPKKVSDDWHADEIACGYGHSLGLDYDQIYDMTGTQLIDLNKIRGWGLSDYGQAGYGDTEICLDYGDGYEYCAYVVDMPVPPEIPYEGSAIALAAGIYHSLALLQDTGYVIAWGANWYGQLGNGTNTVMQEEPVFVSDSNGDRFDDVVAIAAGYYHSLALKSDGTVWAWGNNSYGELGNGTTNSSNIPVQVSGLSNVIAIAAGGFHSLAVKSNGTVWAWGNNDNGQLGNGNKNSSDVPVQVKGLKNIIAVAAGSSHSLALRSNGSFASFSKSRKIQSGDADVDVLAWGSNDMGQLGNGTTEDSTTPVQVLIDTGGGGDPTVVDLVSFDAGVDDDGTITITWETAAEVDNAGFNIYRSRLRDGEYKKINDSIIPAKGDATSGANYRYVDKPLARGTYYYKLEDVDCNGATSTRGPVKVKNF